MDGPGTRTHTRPPQHKKKITSNRAMADVKATSFDQKTKQLGTFKL